VSFLRETKDSDLSEQTIGVHFYKTGQIGTNYSSFLWKIGVHIPVLKNTWELIQMIQKKHTIVS